MNGSRSTPDYRKQTQLYASALAIVIFAEAVISVLVILILWPLVEYIGATPPGGKPPEPRLGFSVDQSGAGGGTVLLLLVLAAGAAGACIHSMTSLATFVGNSSFRPRWILWYMIRVPVGCLLALALYFVLRGGLLTASTSGSGGLNPYAVAAISSLTGMFSKQATDKLAEVFSTIFGTRNDTGDQDRRDKVDESSSGTMEQE